jgi:hypothetical protein
MAPRLRPRVWELELRLGDWGEKREREKQGYGDG